MRSPATGPGARGEVLSAFYQPIDDDLVVHDASDEIHVVGDRQGNACLIFDIEQLFPGQQWYVRPRILTYRREPGVLKAFVSDGTVLSFELP